MIYKIIFIKISIFQAYKKPLTIRQNSRQNPRRNRGVQRFSTAATGDCNLKIGLIYQIFGNSLPFVANNHDAAPWKVVFLQRDDPARQLSF